MTPQLSASSLKGAHLCPAMGHFLLRQLHTANHSHKTKTQLFPLPLRLLCQQLDHKQESKESCSPCTSRVRKSEKK